MATASHPNVWRPNLVLPTPPRNRFKAKWCLGFEKRVLFPSQVRLDLVHDQEAEGAFARVIDDERAVLVPEEAQDGLGTLARM